MGSFGCKAVGWGVGLGHHFKFEFAAVTHDLGLGSLALLGVVVLLLNVEGLLLGLGGGVWDRCFVSVDAFVLERKVLRD